jgi:hypothetical protein
MANVAELVGVPKGDILRVASRLLRFGRCVRVGLLSSGNDQNCVGDRPVLFLMLKRRILLGQSLKVVPWGDPTKSSFACCKMLQSATRLSAF